MKLIKLSQGLFTQVDDEDFEALNAFEWHTRSDYNTFYVGRNSKTINGKRTTIRMHIAIMNTPAGMETDHRDRDGLNNQKHNLRIVTHQQNGFNRNAKGCYFIKRNKKWRAKIMLNSKRIHLGYFKTESEARQAYLKAKEIYHIIN